MKMKTKNLEQQLILQKLDQLFFLD